MILCVTLHTSVDQARWAASAGFHQPTSDLIGERVAGKGVNLARVLATLGCPVRALGMVGQQDRARFETELAAQGIASAWVEVAGPTRRNLTTLDPSLGLESHERRPGFTVGHEQVEAMARLLEAEVSAGDLVVFAGSLPDGVSGAQAMVLARICQRRGAEIALDSGGEVLRLGLDLAPLLIAPNQTELFELTGEARDAPLEVARQGATLLPSVRQVIVTLGPDGALLMDATAAWHARVHVDRPVSSVGCGDALLAGFLDARRQHRSPAECLCRGVACGAAAAMQALAGDLELDDVETLQQRMELAALW
ncbi:MAG: hexose kinase [Pseudomonadota bacterium]